MDRGVGPLDDADAFARRCLGRLTWKRDGEFLYLHVRDGKFGRTVCRGNVNVDLDGDGAVLGIEVCMASDVSVRDFVHVLGEVGVLDVEDCG